MIPRRLPLLDYLIPLAMGILAGTFVIYALARFPPKWAWFAFAALAAASFATVISVTTHRMKSLMFFTAVVSLPIFYDINFGYRDYVESFVSANGYTVTLFDVLVFPLIARWVIDLLFQKEESHKATLHLLPELSILFWILFGINLVSSSLAPEPFFSFSTLYWNLKVLVIFYFIVNYVKDEQTLRQIATAFALILLIEGIVVLEQRFVGSIFTSEFFGRDIGITSLVGQSLLNRPGGTLAHPNALAMFLNMILPLTIYYYLQETGFARRALVAAAILVGLVAEVWSASRGGWLGLSGAMLVTVFLWERKKGANLLAVGGTSALLFTLGLLTLFAASSTFRDRLTEEDYGTAAERVPLMMVARNAIEHNPVIGVGLNNYGFVMGQYDQTPEYITKWYPMPVHNSYLLMAAETGIPSLLVFLAILVLVFRRAYRVFIAQEGLVSAFALGIMGGLIAWCIHNLVDVTAVFLDYTFWFLIGLLGALDVMTRTPSSSRPARGPEQRVTRTARE